MPKLEELLADELRKASGKICEIVAPEHSRLVGEICSALVALHNANAAYQKFGETLNNHGVWWSMLGPMPVRRIVGDYRDRQSRVAYYVREAAEREHISARDIPGELK